jgi:hypothetical protein
MQPPPPINSHNQPRQPTRSRLRKPQRSISNILQRPLPRQRHTTSQLRSGLRHHDLSRSNAVDSNLVRRVVDGIGPAEADDCVGGRGYDREVDQGGGGTVVDYVDDAAAAVC